MSLLSQAHPTEDSQHDWFRNIATIRESVAIFEDLSPDPADQAAAVAQELAVKPPAYSHAPIIVHRPFDEARYGETLHPIFGPWQRPFASRYSDGTWGVWYGAESLNTTLFETVHHWLLILADAPALPFDSEPVSERRVFQVACHAKLLDFRPRCPIDTALLDPVDYSFCQALGRELHEQHYPGLLSLSARCQGEIVAVFLPDILSNPRVLCHLTYTFNRQQGSVQVERERGVILCQIPAG